MSFDENPDYDPFVVEKYVVRNMQFFKRWTLNNITLNQLNAILVEQQMMPALGGQPARATRYSVGDEAGKTTELEEDASPATTADTSTQVHYGSPM